MTHAFERPALLLASTLCAVGLFAWAPASFADKPAGIVFSSQSKIWLEGDSTLHRYHSTARQFQLSAALSAGKGGEGSLSHLELVLPVNELKSGEGGLDDNLYKALKASDYPTIRFLTTGGKLHVSPAGDVDATAEGTLAIAGVEHPVTVHAEGKLTGNTLHLTGTKAVSMSEFGVKPPALFLGAVKCADRIEVHFDLVGTLHD
jgi:polyisoprenoid-binding protein YceI